MSLGKDVISTFIENKELSRAFRFEQFENEYLAKQSLQVNSCSKDVKTMFEVLAESENNDKKRELIVSELNKIFGNTRAAFDPFVFKTDGLPSYQPWKDTNYSSAFLKFTGAPITEFFG